MLRLTKISSMGIFLKKFQKLLLKFAMVGHPNEKLLLKNDEYILKRGTFCECPKQENTYDCLLFSFGVLFHLVRNKNVTSAIFNQTHINYLRQALFLVLSTSPNNQLPDPKKVLSRMFITSFFQDTYEPSGKPDPFLLLLRKINNNINNFIETKSDIISCTSESDDSQENLVEEFEPLSGSESMDSSNEGTEGLEKNESNNLHDVMFEKIFIEDNFKIGNTEKLNYLISEYEKRSLNKLQIKKSDKQRESRKYVCVQHVGCTFSASFGAKGKYNRDIVFKKT